jgi:predicted transcriptional regulator
MNRADGHQVERDVIGALLSAGRPMRILEIAEALEVDPSSVASAIGRLVAEGEIHRVDGNPKAKGILDRIDLYEVP